MNAATPLPDSPADGLLSRPAAVPAEAAGCDPGRMAALAQVAGGIAPALSDLLTVIRGQAGLLLDAAEPDAETREALNQIYNAAEKAGSLMRQLLIFSRQQTMHPEIMDLNVLIGETAGAVRRLLGEKIPVELNLAADLPLIVADREMIEQILLILALNARDAMPTGGRLRIKTAAVASPSGAANAGPDGRPEKFVVLQVDDAGRGIAPEILPHIFEPFFTTKTGGRSTGLGLATVFGILQQHRGWITVDSVPSAGASFKAFLPAAPPDAVAAPIRGTGAGTQRGHETILLVEDDAAVREFTCAVLQQQGYRVLQAASGPDALEAWQWHGARVRLLLTDLVLEDGMTGLQLAARLRAENPALQVICTSGHQRDTMQRFPTLSGDFHFLPKPCRPQTLLAAVRALLDDPSP